MNAEATTYFGGWRQRRVDHRPQPQVEEPGAPHRLPGALQQDRSGRPRTPASTSTPHGGPEEPGRPITFLGTTSTRAPSRPQAGRGQTQHRASTTLAQIDAVIEMTTTTRLDEAVAGPGRLRRPREAGPGLPLASPTPEAPECPENCNIPVSARLICPTRSGRPLEPPRRIRRWR